MAADEDKRLLVKYQQWRCGDEIVQVQQQSKQLKSVNSGGLWFLSKQQIVLIKWFPECIYILHCGHVTR